MIKKREKTMYVKRFHQLFEVNGPQPGKEESTKRGLRFTPVTTDNPTMFDGSDYKSRKKKYTKKKPEILEIIRNRGKKRKVRKLASKQTSEGLAQEFPEGFKLDSDVNDSQLLRQGMMAELDAVSFYEQLASQAKSDVVKKLFLDIAEEEKTHLGEFEAALLELDEEQDDELENGKNEYEELKKK